MDRGSPQASVVPGSVVPGSLVVLAPGRQTTWGPVEGRRVLFGRNWPAEVHHCVGADDEGVSRKHCALEFTGGQWQVRVLGKRPVRIGANVLRIGDEPVPLVEGCTKLLVEGQNPLDPHVVRVQVLGAAARPSPPVTPRRPTNTVPLRGYRLDETERLVVTVLAEEYLRRLSDPQPRSAKRAAEILSPLDPATGWTPKKVEHLLMDLRKRLTVEEGVEGIVPEPGSTACDNSYRRKLITTLIENGTLSGADLHLLGPDD